MKKSILSLFFLSLLLFVACEKPETKDPVGGDQTTGTEQPKDSTGTSVTPDEDLENSIQLVEAVGAYYSTQYVAGVSNDYWVTLRTEDITIVEGNPYGTGEYVYFEWFPKTAENNFPAVGEYTFAEEAQDGCAWSGWEWDFGAEMGYEEGVYVIPQGSFSYVLEDDELLETKYIQSGTISISGTSAETEIFADVVFADGTKATYYYKGELNFENYDKETGGDDTGGDDTGELSWDYEPTESGDYAATFDYCDMGNWGDYYGDGVDFVDLTLNGEEWYAVFNLCAPVNSGENVFGTYKVEAGYGEWTACPSPGGDFYYDYASFIATGFDEENNYTLAYYVASGEVVVAKDGITFDVVSHFGSKIKGEYKGEVVVTDKSTPQYLPAQTRENKHAKRIKLVKASLEDMVYFSALKDRVHK